MTATESATGPTTGPADARTDAGYLRGSSLLLGTRILALVLNLGSQVLVVRALTRSDFGVFAYGMAIVTVLRIVVSLGQERNLPRALALHDERDEPAHLRGAYATHLVTIALTSLVCVAGAALAAPAITASLGRADAADVLVVLVLLAPIDAVDKVLESTFAAFGTARTIAVRKNVLQPVGKLVVIGAVVVLDGTLVQLAVGHLLVGAAGLGLYGLQAPELLRRHRVIGEAAPRRVHAEPVRILRASLPLVAAELPSLAIGTVAALVLGAAQDADAVAGFRAAFAPARVNQLAMLSFGTLFVPMAARLVSRNDHDGLHRAHWQTASWLAVLTFPVFALTAPLAPATTEALFGDRYASSSPLLAVLSLGFYANAAVGLNQQSLQVLGRSAWILWSSTAVAAVHLVATVAVAPRWGAVGVAAAGAGALVVLNLVQQVGLARASTIGLLDRHHARVIGVVAVASLALAGAQAALDPPILVAAPLAGLAWLAVLRATRRTLDLTGTFARLGRLPVLGWLLR